MRKKKREYGTYVDEDTGEVTTVQTTKQAKRDHQKTGKWYKEPTEQEIRAWEREEKQQAAAERVARREENKKTNAAKRAEQEAKERQLKRQMFDAGKITFTQTLAKKDEDQLNLHSWFGGRPQPPKSRKPLLREIGHNANKEQEEDKGHNANGRAAHRLMKLVGNLSHESIDGHDNKVDEGSFYHNKTSKSMEEMGVIADPQQKDKTIDQALDADQDEFDLINSSQDFDIAEDSDAATEVLQKEPDQVGQDSHNVFKIPPLPPSKEENRVPLSPISQSDLNTRATQSLQVSSFKDRLAKADSSTVSSTQAVRDILSGICTQDLALDLEVDELDDKENNEPETEISDEKIGSPVKKSSRLKQVETAIPDPQNQSFTLNESFDYDDIFAELDTTDHDAKADHPQDFDDYGLDDAFFSTLPLTQMVSSARTSASGSVETTKPTSQPYVHSTPAKDAKTKTPFKKHDSFAVEGLNDDDLLEGLEEYERSQRRTASPAMLPKKKRILPWEKQDWTADTMGANEAIESSLGTQDTELL